MNPKVTQSVVHALAIVTGVLGIVAAAAPELGIPPYAVAVVGVVITVLVYVANQIPALGSPAPAPTPAVVTLSPAVPAPPA